MSVCAVMPLRFNRGTRAEGEKRRGTNQRLQIQSVLSPFIDPPSTPKFSVRESLGTCIRLKSQEESVGRKNWITLRIPWKKASLLPVMDNVSATASSSTMSRESIYVYQNTRMLIITVQFLIPDPHLLFTPSACRCLS
jgi:hypothetical protein